MSSSEEEYSDYEDDDLDNTQTGKKRGGKGGDKPSGYKIRNVLKLPRATTYTTQALYEQIHNSDIDLEPEYQRDVVWPESKQIGLIDSIFRNFYIPPVIFVSHQHEDGSESKTCIDGKQRLTSMYRFMDGLIPHKDPMTNAKLWYKQSGAGGKCKILPEKYRRLFANKQIVCIEYQDLSDADEREIFQRVQMGMALTPAEKLQVLSTPMAAFVRTLQSTYFREDSVLGEDSLNWDRSRGGDFRCIAQALYTIAKYPNQNAVGTVPQLEKWLTKPTAGPPTRKGKSKKDDDDDDDLAEDNAFKERIHDTFRVLIQIVGDKTLSRIFLKKDWKVSPVEFVTICLLIATHKDSLGAREVAEKIGEMRTQVRREHVDIRMNGRVSKTLLDFVKGIKNGVSAKRKRDDEAVEASRKKVTVNSEAQHTQASFGAPSLLQPTPLTAKPQAAWPTHLQPPPDPRIRPVPTPPNSNTSGPASSRVDRLAAIHAARHSISSSVASPRPAPSAPAALRFGMERTPSGSSHARGGRG